MLIRDATSDDIEGILAIYNNAVATTTAIWNETEVDAANRAAWLKDHQMAGYPVLVAVENNVDGAVLGYAAFGDWRAFDGYRHTVEHSVYIRRDARGRGIGTALLRELVARARALGKHVMVACVEAGNTGSLRLHEKLGFVPTGLMPEVGAKFGRWLDLAFLQLTLDARATPDGLDASV
ncbi:MAG: GNAT family N-acetyltransferase [Desulfovibrionaceae bacterium CG1_02_65_16]|nr:MAG: GNAT family N-acetyltransferase [Desulfovibrionaceae bacterium CG1_02_65_16]